MTCEGTGAWSDGFGLPGSPSQPPAATLSVSANAATAARALTACAPRPGPGREWPGLRGRDLVRSSHDETGGETEGDLGGDEPAPVHPRIESGVDEAEE